LKLAKEKKFKFILVDVGTAVLSNTANTKLWNVNEIPEGWQVLMQVKSCNFEKVNYGV
jgi:hypothetical protein